MTQPLTDKQHAFALALADPACVSITDAYAKAGYSKKGDATNVANRASALAAQPHVVAEVDRQRQRLFKTTAAIIDAAAVLTEWVTILRADPAELIRARRFCCRYCYGVNHEYQWINESEWADAYAAALDFNSQRVGRQPHKALPEDGGGYGYTRNRKPVATCPRCEGDGFWDTYVTATDELSPAGRKLYAGIKQTNQGVEIKMRDQEGALNNVAKFLGMTPDALKLLGPGGGPIQTRNITTDMDPKEAAKLYAQEMGGAIK